MKADTYDLVADIGGTNTRVALARDGALLTGSVTRFRNADYSGLAEVLTAFRSEQGGIDCAGACAALAGPVRDGHGAMTNLDWKIDEAGLAQATQAEVAVLFNDLQAQGHGLDRLPAEAIRTLINEATPKPGATKLVIGVGTGFNIAPVYQAEFGRIVPPAEAGHATLPLRNEEDLAFAREITHAHGFPAIEDMLSGRGFERIYRHVSGTSLSAAEIMKQVETGDGDHALTAARLFVETLGTVAGDLALIHLPFGGVYFAGGVARAFSAYFQRLDFAKSFRSKGRFSQFMSDFPVFVIEDDYAALSGCAAYLEDRRR